MREAVEEAKAVRVLLRDARGEEEGRRVAGAVPEMDLAAEAVGESEAKALRVAVLEGRLSTSAGKAHSSSRSSPMRIRCRAGSSRRRGGRWRGLPPLKPSFLLVSRGERERGVGGKRWCLFSRGTPQPASASVGPPHSLPP